MAKERGESSSAVWAHLQSQEKPAVWLMGSSACNDVCGTGSSCPSLCLHRSPAATAPGTCRSRGLGMGLSRNQGMRPLPKVQQRPSLRTVLLDSPPRPPFCCSEGKPCGRRLPPPCSFLLLLLLPGLLSCGAPSCSFPGPYLPSQWCCFPSSPFLRGRDAFPPTPGTHLTGRAGPRARETATHGVPQLRAAGAEPRPRR